MLHNGAQVVVKVQRPGLKELFEIDLETLGRVAEVLDKQDDSGRSDFRWACVRTRGVTALAAQGHLQGMRNHFV